MALQAFTFMLRGVIHEKVQIGIEIILTKRHVASFASFEENKM